MTRLATAAMLAACPTAGVGNGYPMQDPVAQRGYALCGGIQGGAAQTREVNYGFYHRQNIPNNGIRELRFFNEAYNLGITNLPVANQIPANTFFALEAIRFDFLYGIDRNGSRATVFAGGGAVGQTGLSGGGAGAVGTDTLTDDQWKAQELIRELMEQGIVTFSVNNRPVFERFALTSFPSGRGIAAALSSDYAGTFAATNTVGHAFAQVSNGAPMRANAQVMTTRYPMPAGCTFDIKINWLALVDFQNATIGPLVGPTAGNPAGTMTCELEGQLVTPASN